MFQMTVELYLKLFYEKEVVLITNAQQRVFKQATKSLRDKKTPKET